MAQGTHVTHGSCPCVRLNSHTEVPSFVWGSMGAKSGLTAISVRCPNYLPQLRICGRRTAQIIVLTAQSMQ